jgi:hypothetical protein
MRRVAYFLVVFGLLLGFANNSYSQYKKPTFLNDPDYDFQKRLRFGFSLGLNFMDFLSYTKPINQQDQTDKYYVDNSRIYPGFNVNVVTDFRILPPLRLRFLPGLAFGQRDLNFFPTQGTSETMNLESSFIELPLSLKYSAIRKTNARPYLIAGINSRIDMAAFKKLNIEEGVYLRLVKADFYYEFGFGYDFFLSYFKLSTELKFSAGLRNAMGDYDPEQGSAFASSIKRMKSQLVTLSFHFE